MESPLSNSFASSVIAAHITVEESSMIQLVVYFPSSTRILGMHLSWIEQMGALWSMRLFSTKRCTLVEYCKEIIRVVASFVPDLDESEYAFQEGAHRAFIRASNLSSLSPTDRLRLRSTLGTIKTTQREKVRVLETSVYFDASVRPVLSPTATPAAMFQRMLQCRAHVLRYAWGSRWRHRRLWSETQSCLQQMERSFRVNFCSALIANGKSSELGQSAMELLAVRKSTRGSKEYSSSLRLAMSALRFLRMANGFKVAFERGATTVFVTSEAGARTGLEGETIMVDNNSGLGAEVPLIDVGSDLGARITTTPEVFSDLSKLVAGRSSYTNEWRPATFALAVRDAQRFLFHSLRDLDGFRELFYKVRFARNIAETFAEPASLLLQREIVEIVGGNVSDNDEAAKQGGRESDKQTRSDGNEARSLWWNRVLRTHKCSTLELRKVKRERELSIRANSCELWERFLRVRSELNIELSTIPRDSLELDDRADAAQAIGSGLDSFGTVSSQIGLQFKLEEDRFVSRYNDIDNLISDSREQIQALRKKSRDHLKLVDEATEKKQKASGMLETLENPKQTERPDVVDEARKIFYQNAVVSLDWEEDERKDLKLPKFR